MVFLASPSFGRLQNRLLIVVILALGAVLGADAIHLYVARLQTIRVAESETAVLARSLAEQARGTLQTTETILLGMRERIEADGLEGAARGRVERLMRLHAEAWPTLHRLFVVDERGRITVASATGGAVGPDFRGDAMFRHHVGARDRGAFLGWAMRDPIDGAWIIPISRRLDHADGSFAGIVVAGVTTAGFRAGYAGLATGRQSVFLLARTDGRVLSRWPADPRGEGQDISTGDFFSRIVGPGDVSRFEHVSMVDGVARYGSYHRLEGLPALVMVGRGKSEVLAPWRRSAALHLAGVAAVLAMIAFLGRRLAHSITEDQQGQAALRETHRRLAVSEARTAQANRWLEMAEQVAQVGHWHLDLSDGPKVTWSDEVYRIHGLNARTFDLTLDNAIAAYHPHDRAAVVFAVEGSMKAGMPFEFTARLVRSDGSLRYVMARGLPQADASGATTGVFGVFMDISQQKRNEAELQEARARSEEANLALEAANRALEELAMQDALTGLANRRHFDRALELEFRRAMRAGNSVALIMIDVDQFKQFNDIYGHPAGDACLRAISGVIPPLLNRPGDSANRYGGEELVVLLPGNTLEGALAMAQRIAAGIRALRIVHAGSAHGVVTISAGVEAFVPVRGRDAVLDLVGHADVALYTAKRAGRDKVMAYREVVATA